MGSFDSNRIWFAEIIDKAHDDVGTKKASELLKSYLRKKSS